MILRAVWNLVLSTSKGLYVNPASNSCQYTVHQLSEAESEGCNRCGDDLPHKKEEYCYKCDRIDGMPDCQGRCTRQTAVRD